MPVSKSHSQEPFVHLDLFLSICGVGRGSLIDDSLLHQCSAISKTSRASMRRMPRHVQIEFHFLVHQAFLGAKALVARAGSKPELGIPKEHQEYKD
jgi:hypothetical protein